MKSIGRGLIACLIFGQAFAARDDLETYVKDHFEDLYKRVQNLDQQSLRFLEIQRQIEELRQENRLLREQVDKLQQQTSNPRPESSTPSRALSNPVGIASAPSERESDRQTLIRAKTALRAREFNQAIALLEPLTASKVNEIAGESQYWLGLSYVSIKDCPKAMAYLNSFQQTNAESPLAPESLTAYSVCQQSLGDVKGAQETLRILKQKYPQSNAAKSLR